MIGLIFVGWLVAAAHGGPQDAEEPSSNLTRVVDERKATVCRGGLVGFSIVPVRCVVGEDGSLEQCAVQSDDPRVLRRRSRYECIAEAVSVFDEEGRPAVGRTVHFRIDGPNLFTETDD